MKARPHLAAVVGLIAIVQPLVGQDDRLPERLRQVARLPAINVRMVIADEKAFEKAAREVSLKTNSAALNGTDADGERYLQIATAHRFAERYEQAGDADTRAIEIFRRRLAANTNEVSALIGLGHILVGGTNHDDGEQLLRRATQLAPTNAQAWQELSSALNNRCFTALEFKGEFSGDELLDVVTRRASLDLVRKLERVHDEAMSCANQAVRFAPERGDVYSDRGACRFINNLLKLRLSGKPINQSNATAVGWSAESISDFKKAAELNPDNPDSVHSVLLYEMAKANFRSPMFSWPEFQAKNQALIDKTLSQLDRLSRSTNTLIALAALRWLASVQTLQSNNAGIVDTCRRIVRLDPSADDAWGHLVGALVVAGRLDEAVQEAEMHLQVRDTARNRLILARVYEGAKRWKEAESQVRKAFEMEPKNVPVNLALAVVTLKEGKVDEARGIITKVEDTSELASQIAYVQGLYWGMKGMRFMAQTQFKKALEVSPDDERATEALKVISGDKVAP